MGAGSAQETKILSFLRSFTGGGSSNCFVDHFAQEIFNSLLGVVYFHVNEGGSSWMVVSLHGKRGQLDGWMGVPSSNGRPLK